MPIHYRNEGLITKTLAASANRAVNQSDEFSLRDFLDLSSLLECCVLLDEVKVLRSPDSLPDSPLTSTLINHGIMTELGSTVERRELIRTIAGLPQELFDRLDLGPLEELIDVAGLAAATGLETPLVDIDDRRIDEVGAFTGVDYSSGLGGLVDQLDRITTYPSIEGGFVRTRVYRSNAYLMVAALHGLDYFPDFERAPFVAGTLRSLYRSLPVQVYERVAAALNSSPTDGQLAREWRLEGTVPIPPITAVVLDRARTPAQIPSALLEVRDEFVKFRRQFGSMKQELHCAERLSDRRRLLEKYSRLLAAASGPGSEFVTAGEMLNVGEKLVKVGANPLSPTSYSAALLAQPAEIIRRWWLRRPLAILFRLDSKIPRISEYRFLVEKHWGRRVDEALIEQYLKHAHDVRRLMDD